MFEGIARSGELNLPEGEFVITTDDLERRRFFIHVVHDQFNNQKVAKVSFVTQAWAEQQNPSIAGITFAHEAPRPALTRIASNQIRESKSAGQKKEELAGAPMIGKAGKTDLNRVVDFRLTKTPAQGRKLGLHAGDCGEDKLEASGT